MSGKLVFWWSLNAKTTNEHALSHSLSQTSRFSSQHIRVQRDLEAKELCMADLIKKSFLHKIIIYLVYFGKTIGGIKLCLSSILKFQ